MAPETEEKLVDANKDFLPSIHVFKLCKNMSGFQQ